MKILIDPGHGVNTPGKRSPDGRFLEYAFNRDIAQRLATSITSLNNRTSLTLEPIVIVPELEDIPLAERCRRVNDICRTSDSILISIHANAFGNGRDWTTPRGWSAYTSKGETRADLLASQLYAAAAKYLPGMKLRTDFSDGDADIEENFYVLRHTLCPAVLTENLFMTNLSDLSFLESNAGKQAIVDLHVEGICEFLCR